MNCVHGISVRKYCAKCEGDVPKSKDPDPPFVCECGEDSQVVLIHIDRRPMCESCIQKLVDSLRLRKNVPELR